MLEKDFRLTVVLHFLANKLPDLRFKWWTCLNKVYYPYFRLSEDLDFTIPVDDELVNSNSKRQAFARSMRDVLKEMTSIMWWKLNDDQYHHQKALWNHELAKKNSTYLKYLITYSSAIDWSKQTIKVEVTYSSKQYFPSKHLAIQSCFVDPVTEEDIFPLQTIQCLAQEEMISEKCRASMTRRTPAIRDFFDLWYLQQQWNNIFIDKTVIISKCKEVSNLERTIENAYKALQSKIDTDLIPMLNNEWWFDLDSIYQQILELKEMIAEEFE